MIRRVSLAAALLASAVAASTVLAGEPITLDLNPAKDNTLFEDPAGALSNGSGIYLFTGRTIQEFQGNPELDLRRALLQFDVAGNVPSGATILSASITLRCDKEISGPRTHTVHRVNVDWGEGASDAIGQEGMGTAAATGDATWTDTFFSSTSWTTAGGDFVASPSASTVVDGAGADYTWSDDQLRADVQDMLDNGASNFGWIIIGDEVAAPEPKAKRFFSREAGSNQPVLSIEYITSSPLEFCQSVDGLDVLEVNGDNGSGSGFTVAVNESGPITFSIDKPAAGGNGKFFIHMNPGEPSATSLDSLPANLGYSCFTFLLNRGAGFVANWNELGKESKIGSSVYFGTPIPDPGRAPQDFLVLPAGDATNLPMGSSWTLQGVIINPATSSPKGVSMTNAIVVSVQ